MLKRLAPLTHARLQMTICRLVAHKRSSFGEIRSRAIIVFKLSPRTLCTIRYKARNSESQPHIAPQCSGCRHLPVLITWQKPSNRKIIKGMRIGCYAHFNLQRALLHHWQLKALFKKKCNLKKKKKIQVLHLNTEIRNTAYNISNSVCHC